MAQAGKGYEEEIQAFLADRIIITGHDLDRMTIKQLSFLYNRYTGEHAKKFLKPETLAYKLALLSDGKCWEVLDWVVIGMVSQDREWFEKGKKRIAEWLEENKGKVIRTPKRYRFTHCRLDSLIGAYNEWDDGVRPFRFEQRGCEPEYWSFRKACEELGYTVLATSEEIAGVEGAVTRVGIYDKNGENAAQSDVNFYAQYAPDTLR